MRSLSSAIQAILAADQQRPVTTVKITLRDVGATEIYAATHEVTISSQPYTGDMLGLPRIVVSEESGIDHIVVQLANADWSYSSYHNQNDFDGATAEVNQYFATDAGYTTFEGPVLLFSGTIFRPEVNAQVLTLNVMADARMARGGSLGRTITNHCGWLFGSTDSNCGYTYSAQVASGGSYNVGDWVPLSGSPATDQDGVALTADTMANVPANYIKIMRGSPTGTEIYTNLYIASSDLDNSQIKLGYNLEDGPLPPWSLSAGDYIVYVGCPRDTIRECARRWQFGSATRQQDKFGGFDYNRDKILPYANPKQGVVAQMSGVMGEIVPIPYGSRWTTPMILGLHHRAHGGNGAWAAWNSTRDGPFVVCIIGEGPLDTGIETIEDDIMLDGALIRATQYYVNQDWEDKFDVQTGTTTQAPSDFFPMWDTDHNLPGFSALRNIGYFIQELPESYDVQPHMTNELWDHFNPPIGSTDWGSLKPASSYFTRTRYWSVATPDIQCKYKGKKVQKYVYSGGVPTTDAYEYSRNPVWQILDVLTASYRTDDSDQWSAGLATSEVDLGSFIDWADYCEEQIDVYDYDGSSITVDRYVSDFYVKSSKRGEVLEALLLACRGALVARDGKVGIVLDAPLGGTGTVTGATSTSITESTRDGLTDASWPTGGVSGLLTGRYLKMLTGAAAGDVRTITSNTGTTINVSASFSTTPSPGDTYAVYAVELNTDNVGPIRVGHKKPLYELTNQVIASYESTKDQGRQATIPIPDTYEDDQGDYHFDKFGLNERKIQMDATTEWQQAVRNGWYELRRELDQNFEFIIEGLNIEGLAVEVGDVALINHDISGITNETVRVTRVEDNGNATYSLVCELFRDHVYLDFPTDDFDSVDISSNLIPPHGVPSHVTGVTIDHYVEMDNEAPWVVVEWEQPGWPYRNWSVVIESRFQNPLTEVWGDWEEIGTSITTKFTFRSARLGMIEVRPTLMSAVGVKANDPLENGTSSGGNTSTTLNDTTRAWDINAWDGCYVRITSGTGDANDPKEIVSNTATELTINGTYPWSPTPDGTSVYEIYVPSPEVQEQITAGIGYGFPFLDEDDGDLFLHPGWQLGLACKYLDSDTAPTLNDVITTGTILTADGAPEDGTNVHTFTTDGEIRYVGIVYYLDEACTQGESGLTVLRYTYHEADNNPKVVWFPYIPDTVGYEGARFVATDDSSQVNFGYDIITEGDPDPTWPGDYTMSGLVADPYVEDIEVPKPAEGATRKVILFNCVDADGRTFRPTDDPGRVYIDGNSRPSGYCTYDIEPDYTPVITPQAIETDTQSWRFRVKKTNIGSEAWDAISWDDLTTGEYSGNTFEPQYMTSYVLTETECLNVEVVFLRTSATDDTTQSLSMKSEAMRFTVYPFFDTVVPTVQAYPGQVGSVGNLYLVINDPKGFTVETAFKAVEDWDGEDFDDPTDGSWNRDTIVPYNLTETVNLGEDHNSLIAWAVGYDLGDGNGTVYIQGSNIFDLDKIPVVFGALHVNANGDVYLSANGREDLKSIQYLTSTTSMPGDVSGGTVVNGRSTNTLVYSGLTDGSTLYIRVRGYNLVGGAVGGGDESTEDWLGQVTNMHSSQIPGVKVYKSQSGSTGTLNILVDDPDGVQVASSFQDQSGGGDFSLSSDPTTWSGYDNSSPYDTSDTVTLVDKHTSFIAWAVGYDLGGGTEWITGTETFDIDENPSGTGTAVVYSNGNASCDLFGDEDTASWKVAASVTSFPTATTVRAQTADDGQSLTASDIGTLVSASNGDTIYYSAFPYSSTGGGGTEGAMVNFIGNYFDTDTLPTDPVAPKAFVVPSVSGSTGTLDLTVRDEYLSVTAIEKRTKQGSGAWSSWSSLTGGTGTIGVDEDLTRSQTVTIEEKHNSEIGIRIAWTDELSATRYTYFSQTYDLNVIPSVVCGLSLTLSKVYLAWIGDDDLASITYKTSTSAMPVDVSGGTTVDGRTGDEQDLGTLNRGEIMYVRVRGYSAVSGGGTASAEDWTGMIRRDFTLIPTVQVVASQSGTTGTVTLNIEDPDSKMNATSFETGISPDANPANWSGYDNSDPYGTTQNITIEEKHPTVIHWGVRYDLGLGDGNVWITGSHTFDIDTIPSVTAELQQVGNYLYLSWNGDEDVGSIKYLGSTGSMPTEANLDASGTYNNNRAGRITLYTGTFYEGKEYYVRLRAYSGASGAGDQSAEDVQVSAAHSISGPPLVKVIATQSGTTGTLTITVDDPLLRVNATAFEPIAGGGAFSPNSDPASWSNYDNSSPYTYSDTVDINPKHGSVIWWGVRWGPTNDSTYKWITGSHTFDADLQAEINSMSLDVDENGYADVSVIGDEDCDNIYVRVGVGSAPTDPTNGSYHGTFSGNNGVATTSVAVSAGDQIYIKARGYNGSDPGPVKQLVVKWVATPIVSVEVTFDDDGYAIVSATAGDDATYIYYNADIGSDPGTPTSSVYDGSISGSSGSHTSTTIQADMGEEVWVNIRAYAGTVAGPVFGIIKARRGVGTVSKTQYFQATGIIGQSSGVVETDGYLAATSTSSTEVKGGITIPQGVVITDFGARLYRGGASDAASASLLAGPYGALWYVIAAATATGTGWTTPYDTANYTVTSAAISLKLVFDANTSGDDVRCDYIWITYDASDVDKTL